MKKNQKGRIVYARLIDPAGPLSLDNLKLSERRFLRQAQTKGLRFRFKIVDRKAGEAEIELYGPSTPQEPEQDWQERRRQALKLTSGRAVAEAYANGYLVDDDFRQPGQLTDALCEYHMEACRERHEQEDEEDYIPLEHLLFGNKRVEITRKLIEQVSEIREDYGMYHLGYGENPKKWLWKMSFLGFKAGPGLIMTLGETIAGSRLNLMLRRWRDLLELQGLNENGELIDEEELDRYWIAEERPEVTREHMALAHLHPGLERFLPDWNLDFLPSQVEYIHGAEARNRSNELCCMLKYFMGVEEAERFLLSTHDFHLNPIFTPDLTNGMVQTYGLYNLTDTLLPERKPSTTFEIGCRRIKTSLHQSGMIYDHELSELGCEL